MEATKVIKEKSVSMNGLTVIQKGNIVETTNKAQKVIHTMDLSYISSKVMVHSWIGFRTSDEFMEICDGHFLSLFKANGCKKILVDISKMTGSFDGVNDWMASQFMPKLVSLGFNCSAVILPSDIFSKISADSWESKVSGFTTRNFGDFNSGLGWLKIQ